MVNNVHAIFRLMHIGFGTAGFVLGAVAIFLPKFRRPSATWHRWVGRAYAVSMLAMALISVPLALWTANIFLLVIGLLTLFWVAAGWVVLRRVKRGQPREQRVQPSLRLRWHVTWMGSSYIAAWTAFLVNVRPLGGELAWMLVYSILPSLVGSYLIARSIRQLAGPARPGIKPAGRSINFRA